jgi:hypothetical protein
MLELPAVTAVTRPDEETVAMAGLPELHVTTRPVRTLLLASRVTADNCTVPPICSVDVAGETETVATGTGAGALTVIADEPVWPSLDAVTDALPAAAAVTTPEAETVAIAPLAELQVTTRPESTLLLASRVTADNCTVAPICSVEVAGDTETVATGIGAGALTVTAALAILPSLEAETLTLPAAFAVTSPDDETVASAVLLDAHVTERPVRTLLAESRVTAESCTLAPTDIVDVAGETVTEATGTGAGTETLNADAALLPSLVAEIIAVPEATALISPV